MRSRWVELRDPTVRSAGMLWLEVNIEAIVALNNVVTRLAVTAYQHVAGDANVHLSRDQLSPVFRLNPKRDLVIAIAA